MNTWSKTLTPAPTCHRGVHDHAELVFTIGRIRTLDKDWAVTRPHEIPVTPTSEWIVTGVGPRYTVEGPTDDLPVLFFDPSTGKAIPEPSLRRLPAKVWALFRGDLKADPLPTVEEEFPRWPGYRFSVFELGEKHQLHIGNSVFEVRRQFFRCDDNPIVRGVHGRDGTQVFFSLPKIEWEGKINLSLTKDGVPQGNIDIEPDELSALLDKPGDYQIELRGPLGESIHRHFLLIPGLTVLPNPQVMWPSQKFIKWHLSAETGSIKSGDTLPPFTRYDSVVECEVVYAGYEVGLRAEVPRLRWRLLHSQEGMPAGWSSEQLTVWLSDLYQTDYPTLECNFGIFLEDADVMLVGKYSASVLEAKRQRSGDQSSWYFDLRRARDELEVAGKSEEFELLIRSKNGTEYFRGKVLSARPHWHIENFFARWKKEADQHVIDVSWREPERPVTGRWLVVIPLWKPWGGAVLEHHFDGTERNRYVWRLPLSDMQPGRYMVKAVHAPWGSDDWIEAQAACQKVIDVYPESWPESFGSQQMTPTVDFYIQALLAHWYRHERVQQPPTAPSGLTVDEIRRFLEGLRLADKLERINIPKDGSGSLNIFCVNTIATTQAYEAYVSMSGHIFPDIWRRALPSPGIITAELSESDKLFIGDVAFQYTAIKTAGRRIRQAHGQRRLSGILAQWHKNLGKVSPPVDEVIFLCEKFRIFEHQRPARKRVYEQLKSEYQSREAV